jgi:hypothetical protein
MQRGNAALVGLVLALCSLCLCGESVPARQKKERKDGPQVIVALPLGVVPGVPTKVTLRGLKLDGATAVRFADPKVTAKVVGKGKASLGKDQQPAQVGDTRVEIEVTVPAGAGPDAGRFAVVTPEGETPAHSLLIETALPVIAEKEPNGGFAQAQPIRLPQVIEGSIQRPQDVDVFRFDGRAGQRVVFEVLAARYGSALDSFLTLYDAGGREVAANDDSDGGTDSRLEVTLPRDGTYYLSLLDAHDQGGPVHVYRLVARLK